MLRRLLVIASVVIVTAIAAGCYWPVPSCKTVSGVKEFKHSQIEMSVIPEGGYRLHYGRFASCKELCAAEAGVLEVKDCKPPELVDTFPNIPNSGKSWKVICDVEAEECHLPEILEPLQWH